jgi:hypothetical protein
MASDNQESQHNPKDTSSETEKKIEIKKEIADNDNDPPNEESQASINEFFDWYQYTEDFKKFCEATWSEDEDAD